MDRRKIFKGCLAAVVLAASACTTHYEMSGVERTRILVDSRYDAVPDAQAAAFLSPYRQHVDSMMNPVVGRTARYLERGRPEGLLSNLLPDILVWASSQYGERPDFGVYNYGGIRAALPAGDVTLGDVLDVAPFENKICFGTLKGSDVLALFQQFMGMGGQGVSHGVRIVYDKNLQLRSAAINGKPVDPEASYRFVTIDYVAQGNDKMEAFQRKTDYVAPQDASNNSREIINNYFREKAAKGELVDAEIEGRIIIEDQ